MIIDVIPVKILPNFLIQWPKRVLSTAQSVVSRFVRRSQPLPYTSREPDSTPMTKTDLSSGETSPRLSETDSRLAAISLIMALYQDDTESVLGILDDMPDDDVFPVLITTITLMESVILTLIAALDSAGSDLYASYEEVIQYLAMVVVDEDAGTQD